MATLMCNNKAKKAARAMIWVIMFFVVLQRVFPFILSNSLHLWILIKRRKFIYIILNFIIISILISSSSFTPYLNDLLLKLHQKLKAQIWLFQNDNGCYNCQKVVDPIDDDVWCFFTTLDHEYITVSTSEEDKKEEHLNHVEDSKHKIYVDDEKETIRREEIIEDDSLEATWKAIMESKGKENRPHLKKSDTWSYGDGGVSDKRREKGRLSKSKVKGAEFKKWQSFREGVGRREIFDDGSFVGDNGGWKHGRRSMEAALTFHDDLKKRSDAFIARVTQDIQLERLESDQRILDIINRGM